jgi:ATP-dependent Clp protease ATP-binding subunit ClpB
MAAEQTIHLERYSPSAKALVSGAQSLADERKHALVEPIHLLVRALDRDKGVQDIFRKAGADPSELAVEAESALARVRKSSGELAYLSNAMLELLGRAEKEAGAGTVDVEQVLNALSQELRGPAAVAMQALGLGPGSLRPYTSGAKNGRRDAREARSSGDVLSRFTTDMIDRARRGLYDPVIGRDAQVRRLLQILERRQKNNALLTGEAGVGKTAIVRALAMRLAAEQPFTGLAGVRLLKLETGLLIAGAKLRGEIEERLRQVLDALEDDGERETLLHVSDVDSLLGQGLVGSGVGDLLKPMLDRSEVRLVASTTIEGRRRIEERDPGLLRRFSIIAVEPPAVEPAIEILRGVASKYEAHHNVQIGEGAIVAAVRLAKRYLQDRALPDAAIDLLDETAARKRVELDGLPADTDIAIGRLASLDAQIASLAGDADALSVKTRDRLAAEARELGPVVAQGRAQNGSRRAAATGQGVITEEEVARVLGDWTGIPMSKMLETESDKLLKMETRLARRVVGQDEAVRAVSRAVRRGRVGLRDPGKPIGSFLFLGPSGVGKTELAKALAEFLFDDEQAMTRLDMSEFMEKHMAQRLVGAPPGYVDSEEGGFLTEAVRRRPYSVLLFDEVEKAHADVFNLLLQVLDDGRLTDGRGRTADFSNTVVIMTSNIGGKRLLETDPKLFDTPEGIEAMREVLQEDLRAFLRPEFLNRIDDVILFRPLSKKDLRGIVEIQLTRLEKMLADRELHIELSTQAKDRLVDLGYEPAFGARPLRRAILKNVQDALAERILEGGFPPASTVKVDVDGESFTLTKA